MKKILGTIIAFLALFLCGCGKTTTGNLIESLGKKMDKIDSYKVNATMTIKKDDREIVYDLEIKNLDENYIVKLKSRENNSIQVIVKNENGVFVLNPELNKCFKFNSKWPSNSSNGYLLKSIYKDIINDNNVNISKDNDYLVISSVNHKTNANWSKQKVVIDKKTLLPKSLEILNEKNEILVTVNFTDYDLSPNLSKSDFDQENNMKTAINELGEGTVGNEENVFFTPNYIPVGSTLEDSYEDDDNTNKTSLYGGDNTIVISQIKVDSSLDMEYINMYGEIVLLDSGFGSLSDNVLSWYSNKMEYLIFSNTLEGYEMINIANSFRSIKE